METHGDALMELCECSDKSIHLVSNVPMKNMLEERSTKREVSRS